GGRWGWGGRGWGGSESAAGPVNRTWRSPGPASRRCSTRWPGRSNRTPISGTSGGQLSGRTEHKEVRPMLVFPRLVRGVALLAPAALVAVFAVLAAGDPPASEPPAAANPAPRTDRFGDPLPAGVLVRLGTPRSRANIASFGVLPDGTVVTVSPFVEVSVWPPKAERPGEPVRLIGPKAPPFDPRPAVSPDGRYV